jgi:hypothetical protein
LQRSPDYIDDIRIYCDIPVFEVGLLPSADLCRQNLDRVRNLIDGTVDLASLAALARTDRDE